MPADRIVHLLNYALNPSASLGELENAGLHALKEAKKRGANDAASFAAMLAAASEGRVQFVYRVPPDSMLMPFGKYAGQTLGSVFARDPAYIRWFVDNVKRADDALLRAARELLTGGPTHG